MKRTSFMDEQIIVILKEIEAGAKRGNMAPLPHRQATWLGVLSPADPGNGSAAIWQSRRFHREQTMQTSLRQPLAGLQSPIRREECLPGGGYFRPEPSEQSLPSRKSLTSTKMSARMRRRFHPPSLISISLCGSDALGQGDVGQGQGHPSAGPKLRVSRPNRI